MPINVNVNLDTTGSNQSIGGKTVTLNTQDRYVTDDIVVNIGGISAGTLNNQASNGVTYANGDSPSTVLNTGDCLYINAGWFPNTKVSLSNLIPDIATGDATVGHIRYGYKAYSETGTLLEGNMLDCTPSFTGGDLTITPTVTVIKPRVSHDPTGSFLPLDYSGTNRGVGDAYGVTETEIGGTEGTDFLSIDCVESVTNGSCTPSASVNRADVTYSGEAIGYINQANGTVALSGTSSEITASRSTSIAPSVTDGFKKLYIPIVSESYSMDNPTATAAISSITNPVYKKSMGTTKYGTSDATSTNLTNYGITSVTSTGGASGYITFVPGGSYTTTGSVTSTADATTKPVLLTRAAGVVKKRSGSTVVSSQSATQATATSNLNPTSSFATSGAVCYSIAIVSPQAASPTITAGTLDQGALTATVTNATISHSGAFTSSSAATTYGIVNGSLPSGMTDGTNCLAITTSGQAGSIQIAGTITIPYTRSAIVTNNAYKGAVSLANGAQLAAQATGKLTGDFDIFKDGDITGGTTYYVPIVTPSVSGGSITSNTTISMSSADSTGTAATTISVTPSVAMYDRSGTTTGTTEVDSTYGVTTTTPTSGHYVKLDPGATGGKKVVNASKTVTTSNIVLSCAKGITAGASSTTTGASQSLSGSYIVGTNIAAGTDKYIPVVESATMSGGGLTSSTTVSPSVTSHSTNTGGAYNINVTPYTNFFTRTAGTNGTTAINEATYGITTNPNSTSTYIIVDPAGDPAKAKVVSFSKEVTRAAVTATVSAGITAGFTSTSNSETQTYSGNTTVGTSIRAGNNKYIPVVTPTAEIVSHTQTNPTCTYSSACSYSVSGAEQQTTPTGIVTSTSNPSDFTTKNYLVFAGSATTGTGSCTATFRGKISAGITAGGNGSNITDTKTLYVSAAQSTTKIFIKCYDGSYTLT